LILLDCYGIMMPLVALFCMKGVYTRMVDAIYTRQSVDRVDSISIESQLEFCKYETRGGEFNYYSDRGFPVRIPTGRTSSA